MTTDRITLAVGDWIVADSEGGVAAVLERRSLLERRMPDDSSSSPVGAANVDVVVVANALDHAFSARRPRGAERRAAPAPLHEPLAARRT